MIDPQFLAPDGASSLGAIAIGLLAETFLVLIINSLGLLAETFLVLIINSLGLLA